MEPAAGNLGAADPPRIVKEGFIYKRAQHNGIWRKLYFVLREDGSFVGYQDKPGPQLHCEPCNIFCVKSCQILWQDGFRAFSFHFHGLKRTEPVSRVFSVDSFEERKEWVDALERISLLCRDKKRQSNAVPYVAKLSPDDFELLKVLGRGSFGRVFLAREKSSDQLCAIKIISKKDLIANGNMARLFTERKILQKISHPFLISMKSSFESNDLCCFVMDYIKGGELYFHLTRERYFIEERVRFYGAEILLALEYLHKQGILFRDLKLENLLLDHEGHIKITDFGLCKDSFSYGATTRSFCGTPTYLAPEMLEYADYGFAVDWWAFGVIMYEMLCGQPPFYSESDEEMYELILEKEVSFSPRIRPTAKNLISQLLKKDPSERLGGSERDAQDIKEHPFFQRVPWHLVLDKRLVAPFIPMITSDLDTRNFAAVFTNEAVALALDSRSNRLGQMSFDHFRSQVLLSFSSQSENLWLNESRLPVERPRTPRAEMPENTSIFTEVPVQLN